MPSIGGPMDRDSGLSRVDVVLGDCYAHACAPHLIHAAEVAFRDRGYRVVRNAPYAGGYVTRAYGRPRQGSHALQIELNRALYMNEAEHQHGPEFEQVRADIDCVVESLAAIAAEGPSP
jgi:N-formylglutamate amidohydrolase